MERQLFNKKHIKEERLRVIEQNEIENSNELPSRESKMNSEILRISIQLPKILVPCVNDMCIITRRKRDDLFTFFVKCGLVEFYDEPERIFTFAKRTLDFLERLRIGLNQYYGKEYFKNKHPPKPENAMVYNSTNESKTALPQSNKELNTDEQILEFKLILPDILMESFIIFCEVTNRTKEYLSKLFIMDQLAFLYQNPELMYGYIKDYENIMERLRTGLNLIFGRNYFKKEVKG